MQTTADRIARRAAADARLSASGLTPAYFETLRRVAAAAKAAGYVGAAVPLDPRS